jgi:hypothetical protein
MTSNNKKRNMMKNDIRHITLGLALAVLALAGCTGMQEKDLFEESPALRIEHSANKLKEILVSAPNGWVMQYYTGDAISVFEGFNLFARFENSGKVTIAGNHRFLRDGNKNKYTEASSLYELLREDGLVLAFNTWNDVLTPFVDPVAFWAAPENLFKDGEGMMGDQNLVVTSMTQNEIRLRGERYRGNVRLIRADRDWKTYISDTEEMKKFITSDKIDTYYLMAGNELMYCVGLRNGRYRLSEKINNYLKNDSISCCFTPTGLYNEEPDTVAGHIFQEFKLNDERTALVNEDGTVRLVATWDTYFVESSDIKWMDPETMSDNIKTLFSQVDTDLKAIGKTYTLQRIGFGRSQKEELDYVDGLVLEWLPSKRAKPVVGGLAMKYSLPKIGQVTYTYDENAKADETLKSELFKKPAVEASVRQLAAALAGTYQMTPDNTFNPTSVQFQTLDGAKSFSLGF